MLILLVRGTCDTVAIQHGGDLFGSTAASYQHSIGVNGRVRAHVDIESFFSLLAASCQIGTRRNSHCVQSIRREPQPAVPQRCFTQHYRFSIPFSRCLDILASILCRRRQKAYRRFPAIAFRMSESQLRTSSNTRNLD